MKNILVIEDDNANLELICHFLELLGYKVNAACNGLEGVELFNSGLKLDLIITDIMLPKFSGNDFARFIRNSGMPSIPIIGIAGGADNIDQDAFNSILTKPFKLKELEEAVAIQMQGSWK